MSVINKMLQDLDRRHAEQSGLEAGAPVAEARAARASHIGSDWFWRVLAVLMLVAVVWVVWLMWELRPRAVVTELALKSPRPPASPRAPDAPPKPAPPPTASQDQPRPADIATLPPNRFGGLRLATTLDLSRPAAQSAIKATETRSALNRQASSSAPAAAPAAPATRERPAVSSDRMSKGNPSTAASTSAVAELLPPVAATSAVRIEKRPPRKTAELADIEFQRALASANQGRSLESIEASKAALAINPAHHAARQTLASQLVTSRRFDDAIRTLDDGLQLDPVYLPFSMLLARVIVERGDAAGALAALDRQSANAAGNAEFRAFRAALKQRLDRHPEAVEDYRAALAMAPEAGQWWLGLGISLQAQAQPSEALAAFRRARSTGALPPGLLDFADQRIRQLSQAQP